MNKKVKKRLIIRKKQVFRTNWKPDIPEFIAKEIAKIAMKRYKMEYAEFIETFVRVRIDSHKPEHKFRRNDFELSMRSLTLPSHLRVQYSQISDDRLRSVDQQLWWDLNDFITSSKKRKTWLRE